MGDGEGENEAGMVTSTGEEVGGAHGEANLAAMPVRRAAEYRDPFGWLTLSMAHGRDPFGWLSTPFLATSSDGSTSICF